jgi:hypothetical protein
MSKKFGPHKTTEKHLRDSRRKTRRQFAPGENIHIVLDGLRGEYLIVEPCHHALSYPHQLSGIAHTSMTTDS